MIGKVNCVMLLFRILFCCYIGVHFNQLLVDVKASKRKAYAAGTMINLKTQWKTYFMFCIYFELDPFALSSTNICAYLQFISRSLSSYSSVINYLGAVKVLCNLLDLTYPKQDMDLKLTLKGLRRTMAKEVKQAQPITPNILLDMFSVIDIHDPGHITYWCAFLFLYFLMFRSSQLFPKTTNVSLLCKVLKRKDVTIVNDMCFVSVNWSKTIQYKQKKVTIPLRRLVGSPLCPVAAFELMCELVPASAESVAFGSTRGGYSPILYGQFQKKLRKFLTAANYDAAAYSSHSFRRGAATWAFKNGVPEHMIKLYGDWSSDAYRRYLDVDLSQKVKVFDCMARLDKH